MTRTSLITETLKNGAEPCFQWKFLHAYIGLEAESGARSILLHALRERRIEAHPTLGGHDIVCRSPSFADLAEFRALVDSILFITAENRAIVANSTTYIILDQLRKQADGKTAAFCFIRSGKLPSRESFDKMVHSLLELDSVLSVSVTIGFFDLVCEIQSKNIADLRRTVDQVLSTEGVSSRAIMVCMVSEDG